MSEKIHELKKISTIQKRNNLNTVFRDGDPGPGGAYHDYVVDHSYKDHNEGFDFSRIAFQKGPRNDPDARHGVLDVDLLEIVRDRLTAFQAGPFACRENAIALTHIETALLFMNKRVEDRADAGILGTMKTGPDPSQK